MRLCENSDVHVKFKAPGVVSAAASDTSRCSYTHTHICIYIYDTHTYIYMAQAGVLTHAHTHKGVPLICPLLCISLTPHMHTHKPCHITQAVLYQQPISAAAVTQAGAAAAAAAASSSSPGTHMPAARCACVCSYACKNLFESMCQYLSQQLH